MKTLSASEIAEMPIQMRIQLVEDLWNSILELPETLEIPNWHKEELEKRLTEYNANPNEGSTWLEVKKSITG